MFPKDTHVPIRHIESCNEKPSDEIISTFISFARLSLVMAFNLQFYRD